MKKMMIAVIMVILFLLTLNIISASDTNKTQETSHNNITYADKNTKHNVKETNTDEGCSTCIVQGKNNDSAVSFRRDTKEKVTLNVKYNKSILKQYKTQNSYFCHVIISKDGWVMGNGGFEDEKQCSILENNTMKMFENNKISYAYLNSIYKIKKKSKLAHYVIKSPNGTYNLIIVRKGKVFKDSGKLLPGQYLVVPNSYIYFKKGKIKNFKDTPSKMLSYVQKLSAQDKYGVPRRQILSYYYKNNIYNSSIKVVVSNDDGRYVGVRSGHLVDNIKTKNRFISSEKIPKLNRYLDVEYATFIVKKIKTKIKIDNKIINESKISFKATITDELNHEVNEGYVSIYVNNKILRYLNHSVVFVKVKNGKISYDTTLDLWKNKNFTYYIKYHENKRYNTSYSKNATIKVNDFFSIKSWHKNQIKYKDKFKIITKIFYNKNKSLINEGKISYKINNHVIKNNANKTLYKKVVNGSISTNITFNSYFKTGKNQITIVYENGVYTRKYTTPFYVKKSSTET